MIVHQLLLLTLLALAVPGQEPAAAPLTSVYTELDPKKCQTTRFDQKTSDSTQVCPGVAGYKLQVDDARGRVTVTVLTPKGARHPLNFVQAITPNSSALGPRAEWRVTKRGRTLVPHALIVRVNARENPNNAQQITSYLAVASITSRDICVIDRIAPSATANEDARRAADSSAGKACLK